MENKSEQGHNGTIMGLKSISRWLLTALLRLPKIHSVHLALNGMQNGAVLAVGVATTRSYICSEHQGQYIF